MSCSNDRPTNQITKKQQARDDTHTHTHTKQLTPGNSKTLTHTYTNKQFLSQPQQYEEEESSDIKRRMCCGRTNSRVISVRRNTATTATTATLDANVSTTTKCMMKTPIVRNEVEDRLRRRWWWWCAKRCAPINTEANCSWQSRGDEKS